jgi:hypothetical protein
LNVSIITAPRKAKSGQGALATSKLANGVYEPDVRQHAELPQAEALSKASSMMRRMVRAQRPHCALQPRQ